MRRSIHPVWLWGLARGPVARRRGFGVVPVRINAPPQAAFFELVPGEGGR